MKMKLSIQGVSFGYPSTKVLDDVSVQVGEGEIMSILGPNGSGKSTLLKCIDGILRPQRGTILVTEMDTARLKPRDLAKLVGYVPQSAVDSFPFTVFDTVLMGRLPYLSWSPRRNDLDVVSELLELLELKGLALRHITELSGGERQKVLLARALAQQPKVLLLDEPTANLDIRHQMEVLSLVRHLVKEQNLSALIAMHDVNLACRFSDKIVLLKKGQISAAGDPASVITEASLRDVYGITAVVNKDSGRLYIIPLASV